MKKGFLLLLIALVLLPTVVCADVVGYTDDGGYIHAYLAPNGQTIYFTALEAEPTVIVQDVNFDGQSDLVVITSMGASNIFCEFFVFDNGRYVWARHDGWSGSLCNFELYPEAGIVGSYANNGYAGALHEDCLFRWEGTNLKLIRESRGEELSEVSFGDGAYIVTTYRDRLHLVINDYTSPNDDRVVLWESVIALDAMDAAMFDQQRALLWQGL